MRKSRNDLQELLQSLTKAEVVACTNHIKQLSSLHRNYLMRMFKGLHKAGGDEEKLKKSLLKENPRWDFAHYKKTLGDIVYHCLVSERHLSTVENRLRYMLEMEKVFYMKSLFVQCHRLLKEARSLAELYEYHLIEIEILNRQGALLNELFTDTFRKDINEINKRRIELIKLLDCETQYRNLCYFIFLLQRKYDISRSKELEMELKKLQKHPLLKDYKLALNFRSKRFFNNATTRLCEMQGNREQSLYYMKQNYKLWQQHPHQQKEKAAAYRSSLCHLSGTYLKLERYQEGSEILKEARKIHVLDEKENSRWFREIKLFELSLCLNTADFDMLPELLKETEKGLKDYSLSDAFALTLIYNAAVCCFITEDYSKTLHWLRRINDYEKSGARQDIRDFSLLFKIVVWYCSGKTDLVEDYIDRANRFYKKNNMLYPLEALFIAYLPKLISTTSLKENRHVSAQLLKEVNKLIVLNKQPLGTMELAHWLKSLSTGVSMVKLLKEGKS
jgi:hypothetical protein